MCQLYGEMAAKRWACESPFTWKLLAYSWVVSLLYMSWVSRAFSCANLKSFAKGRVVLINNIMSNGKKHSTRVGCPSDKERLVWVDCEVRISCQRFAGILVISQRKLRRNYRLFFSLKKLLYISGSLPLNRVVYPSHRPYAGLVHLCRCHVSWRNSCWRMIGNLAFMVIV